MNGKLTLTNNNYKQLIVTGVIGLIASLLVGTGEFLLHFDILARFSEGNYDFMLNISDKTQTIGHFIGVLSAPLYIIGCWHIYLMLKPANQRLAFVIFIVSAYGFMIGADWISSRASIGAIVHHLDSSQQIYFVDLYQLRYENLLTVIRFTTLTSSILFIYLVLTGRTLYQKWHAIFNPILLLVSAFIIYLITPTLGKYIMPIALNVAYAIFFSLSIIQVIKYKKRNDS